MSLSLLQLILVAGACQGFLLAFLLLTRNVNPLANRLLGLVIFLISVQTLLVGFDNRDFFMRFPHLSKIAWLLPSLFGPLLFLFTQKLISENPRWKKKDLIHFIPFVLCFFYLLPYYLQSTAEKRSYLTNFEIASLDDFGGLNQLLNLLHIGYVSLALVYLHRHRLAIQQSFSDTEQLRLDWLQQLLLFVLVVIVFSVLVFYARKWNIGWMMYWYHYHYLGVVALMYWIGYKALAQPRLFNMPVQAEQTKMKAESDGPKKNKYQKSALTTATAENYAEQLVEAMEESKMYLQQELTLQELAGHLTIPKHQLSQLINERFGKNFYDFVNGYRVEEAKQLLLNEKYSHFTTLAIAQEAGFNSKATFNAVFKKTAGCTPSEYVKMHKEVV